MDQIVVYMEGKRKPCGFATLLSSAVCEWFLMFLLFVDAALSYFLTKFAQYCELKTPCLFCSRLEYGFGKKKPGFYWSLLCSSHREEISTFVSCPMHGNFANANEMCGECLAMLMQEKLNSDPYRLMVGKAWLTVDKSVLQSLLVNKKLPIGSSDRRICSCCGKSWKVKTDTERFFKLNPVTNVAAKANLKPPLPRVSGRSRFSRKESLKRLRDKVSERSMTAGGNCGDVKPHFGRGRKKISSHSDTEVLLSEDEGDGKMRSCETYSEPDYDAQGGVNSVQTPIVDNNAVKESKNLDFKKKSLILEQHKLVDLSEQKNICSLLPGTLTENGQGDLNGEKSYKRSSPALQQISLDDSTQQLDIPGGSFGVPAETSKSMASHPPHIQSFPGLLEPVPLGYDPSSNNGTMTLTKINAYKTNEVGDVSVAQHSEAASWTSSDGCRSLEPNNMHQTDALAESMATGELLAKHESSVDEDTGSQVHPVPVLLDKTDSNNEILDGLVARDTEGESIIDKLQHQIKLDQNYINSLLKELEEERNASAIAANEAMAMITRLQEEKAALHMEALQYLRMMEEQAEYDVEELARTHDLLAEREKELQDMEHELDFYREYVDDDRSATHATNSPSALDDSLTPKVSKINGSSTLVNGLFSPLEESQAFISQSLKKMEKKLQQGYANGKLGDMANSLSHENIKTEENGYLNETRDQHASNHEEIDHASMLQEIKEFRGRLEALETDYKFLQCATDLLQNENGLQLVQEIARQLQEIRKIEFSKR